MCAFVDLEVLTSGEDFAASWEGAWKWLLSRMDSDVVHKLVLGLEGFADSGTLLPVTCMVPLLWSPDVVNADVCHNLVHGAVDLAAWFVGIGPRTRIHPHTHMFLLDLRSHVPEEGSMVWLHVVHSHVVQVVRCRWCHLGVGIRSGIDVIVCVSHRSAHLLVCSGWRIVNSMVHEWIG